jgi:hypothetical protein
VGPEGLTRRNAQRSLAPLGFLPPRRRLCVPSRSEERDRSEERTSPARRPVTQSEDRASIRRSRRDNESSRVAEPEGSRASHPRARGLTGPRPTGHNSEPEGSSLAKSPKAPRSSLRPKAQRAWPVLVRTGAQTPACAGGSGAQTPPTAARPSLRRATAPPAMTAEGPALPRENPSQRPRVRESVTRGQSRGTVQEPALSPEAPGELPTHGHSGPKVRVRAREVASPVVVTCFSREASSSRGACPPKGADRDRANAP